MDANSQALPLPFVAKNLQRRSFGRRSTVAAALFISIGICSVAVDLPLSQWMRSHPAGDGASKLLDLSEAFAHGGGAALLLIAAAILDERSRRRLPRAAAIAFGAGLAANVGKLLLARWRPRSFAGDGSAWDSFCGWLPWLKSSWPSAGVRWGSHLQSFPSAHAATGFGLAMALTWLYPQGRWLFAALAALSALQRIEAGAHFPSDVCFGAAIGCLTAGALLGDNRLGRWFGRREEGAPRENAAASRAAA